MKFIVYSCTSTFKLCVEANNAGFQHVWTPHRLVKKLRQPKNKPSYVESVWEAAIPGYIYGPWKDQDEFKAWCPSKYDLNVLPEYYGPPGLPKHLHVEYIRPASVDLEDLQDHDAAVRALLQVLDTKSNAERLQVGDVVELHASGSTVQGVIRGFKQRNRIRVEIPLGFITIEQDNVKKVG